MTQARYWQDLTTEDFRALDVAQTVALLPVGAVEQHGPHLPVGVDAQLAERMVARMLALAPPTLNVLVLPVQAIGKSNEHGDFPGTLSLSAETLIRVWTEIAEAVARVGIRRLVIFNAHGGNPSLMEIVCTDLRARLRMLAVRLSWFDFGLPEGLFSDDEHRHGIHGGEIETSLMLHLAPAAVRRDKAQDFPSLTRHLAGEQRWLNAIGKTKFAWQAQDLNPHGVCGNAAAADPERGALLFEHVARELIVLLDEVQRFPLAHLDTVPGGGAA